MAILIWLVLTRSIPHIFLKALPFRQTLFFHSADLGWAADIQHRSRFFFIFQHSSKILIINLAFVHKPFTIKACKKLLNLTLYRCLSPLLFQYLRANSKHMYLPQDCRGCGPTSDNQGPGPAEQLALQTQMECCAKGLQTNCQNVKPGATKQYKVAPVRNLILQPPVMPAGVHPMRYPINILGQNTTPKPVGVPLGQRPPPNRERIDTHTMWLQKCGPYPTKWTVKFKVNIVLHKQHKVLDIRHTSTL